MEKLVVYHSADFDGVGCCEVAKKFLGTREWTYVGWNFGDPPITVSKNAEVIIMDLPPTCVEGWENLVDLTWIDHHKSSIQEYAKYFSEDNSYLIDGVAACRLAYQWFWWGKYNLPEKEDYIDRTVDEPLCIRLLGEYDIWRKDDPRAETLQYGLRSKEVPSSAWLRLLDPNYSEIALDEFLMAGKIAQAYQKKRDASAAKNAYLLEWEGLKFLTINSLGCNSLTFESVDKDDAGHDALMVYCRRADGSWSVSMYHAKHRTDLDLSVIAAKYGGGGHRGACGFTCKNSAVFFTVIGN